MTWPFLWLSCVAACDFPRLDGRTLTREELALVEQPVLVYGLGVPELPALPLEEMVQVSNGRNEEGHRRYVNSNLSNYLQKADSMRLEEDGRESLPTIFLSDLLTKVQRTLWHGLQLPKLMDGFTARPILSIGVKNSGEDFHNHEETWLWLAKGTKAWWIADATELSSLRQMDPCTLPEVTSKGSKLRFCVQHPGDVIFFKDHAHATCNLDDLVVGLGAQGREEGLPELARAAQSGQLKRVEEAIGQQQVDALVGRSAMHFAAIWGHQEAAQLLLNSGAQLRKDREGLEPIHLAALHGHAALVEFLSNTFEGDRFELMHRAAMQGHREVMTSLLKGSKLPISHRKAIHFAAKGGHIEAVDFLLQNKASLEEVSKPEGLSPLHFAASQGHLELVRHLMHLDADLVAKDSRGLQPIHLAVHADSARVVREMMESGHFPKDLGHFAAEGGRLRALRSILKQHAAAATAVDLRGFQPMHLAAMAGHREAIQMLLEHGASVKQPEAAGFTSLHFAAKGGHRATVQRLLELRAEVTRSRDGTWPKDVASRMQHSHLLELLDEANKDVKKGKGKGEAKAEL